MRTQASFALLQSAKEIRVSLAAGGQKVVGLLTEEYPPPVVDGQPLFDYDKQVQHLMYSLETAEGRVVVAEDNHMKQQVRVSRLRTERDQKAADSYQKLIAARQSLDGLQGPKAGFETVFVSGRAPRRPERLLEQLAQSVTLLDDPAVEPSPPKIAGVDVDHSAMARDLESGMLELRATMDQLAEAKKLAEGTMLARDQAVSELKSTVIWAGRTAEGLFQRAGEDELAQRIRKSTRRPLRPSEEPAEQTPAETQADNSLAPDSVAGEPADEPVTSSTEPTGQPSQTTDS